VALNLNTPDFFRPKVTLDGDIAMIDCETWDKDGKPLRVGLQAGLPQDASAREHTLELMRNSAWQAVWLAAQGKYLPPAEIAA
jgi:hypothetical protein